MVEMFDHIMGLQPARGRRQQFDHRGREIKGVDVLAKGAFDIGAQHLYRDLLACAGQARIMHLRDRGRRNCIAKFAENLFNRLSQFLGNRGFGHIRREWRQLILQHPQLCCQIIAHQIGARR